MASFQFIHAADIHLDSPLRGLARHEGSAVEQIRSATREAFDNLVSQAIEEHVAFVVIAGDLYDGDWRDFQTGLFFSHEMGRLGKAGIDVFLLYGNHDAENQITKRLSLPDNVKVFPSRRPGTFTLDGLDVSLHGQSFRRREVTENMVLQYPDPVDDMFNIGVLHTALGGLGGHENYAPCSLSDLVTKGYDYWALGHVHKGQVIHEYPHVVFPGNLQGRHIRETGPKGARLITVADRHITEFANIFPDVVRWAHLPVPVDKCGRAANVIDCVRQAIEQAVSVEAEGRLLACRIELTGQTDLHAELLASTDHLLMEARSAALGAGDGAAWIEKLVVATEPTLDPEVVAGRQDALGELQRMLGEADADDDLVRQLETDVADMARKLPLELRRDVEDPVLQSAIEGDYTALLAHVRSYLTGRLMAGGE